MRKKSPVVKSTGPTEYGRAERSCALESYSVPKMIPRCALYEINSFKLWIPNFCIMLVLWVSAVRGLISNNFPISELLLPQVTSASTSRSRLVRVSYESKGEESAVRM